MLTVKRRHRVTVIALFCALVASPVYAEQAPVAPANFLKYAKSAPLAGAGILVENLATKEILYQSDISTLRAPASVLKLISMTTALTAYDATTRFKTTIATTDQPNKFILTGEGDPWLTSSAFEAKKYHRAFLPYLINKIRAANPHLKSIQLDYANVYALDVNALKKFFGQQFKIYPHKLSSQNAANSESKDQVASISSPPLSEIVKFTLLWSDNVLADRLAHLAAAKLGFGTSTSALQDAFTEVLKQVDVPSDGLAVFDGNGLSKETRVSAQLINDLLIAIRGNPKFQTIYDGLPLAGKTGTLKSRFVTDAPKAVGLIKAKTGWINTTVSLAGFVKSGSNEYVFTVIDSGLTNRESVRSAARIAIDRMLVTLVQR